MTDVNGATKDVIQLGTVTINTAGTDVPFALKLQDPTGCDLTGLTNADFTFASQNMGATGIVNGTGTATGTYATVTPVNATNTTPVASGHQTVSVPATEMTTNGAKFNAKLQGGAVPGTYASQVSFAVAYN